jgi:hypothetical protein
MVMLWFWFWFWFVLFVLSLASAVCFWSASVAPVRGGTYFLCRRKESRQRKRAHTASACYYPRALNVPALHAVTHSFMFVANETVKASPASHVRTRVDRVNPSRPICGKLCVGFRAAK